MDGGSGDAQPSGRDASIDGGGSQPRIDAGRPDYVPVGDAQGPDEVDAGSEEAGPPPVLLPDPLVQYRFDEGAGERALDSSNSSPLVHLEFEDPQAVTWTANGLRIDQPTRLSSVEPPVALMTACQASNELYVSRSCWTSSKRSARISCSISSVRLV